MPDPPHVTIDDGGPAGMSLHLQDLTLAHGGGDDYERLVRAPPLLASLNVTRR